MRTFGRARGLTRDLRLLELALGRLYGNGWPAAIARWLGLQPDPVLRTHRLPLAARPPAAPTLRVGFATDFHAGPTTHPRVLERACRELADAAPDVVLLTGDFVSLHARHVGRLVPMLAEVPAPLGRFAVLGNHDLVGDDRHITAQLECAGVRVLTNRAVPLPAPHEDVWLCGLDDPTRGAACGDVLDAAPGTRLVLMHSPDGLLAIGERHFDAAFCGHTHGGQVKIPGVEPLVVPEGRLSRRFLEGVFCLGPTRQRILLVSRGIGCSTIPVRLFARPEVHLCLLAPAASGAAGAA